MIIDSGSRDGPLGPVLSSTFAIQPCAHRGQNLGHIPYQVIVNLGRVHHDQLPTLSGQRSVDILRTEPAEPIPMLNHNPRDRQIAQHRRELTSVPVEHRPDLGDNLVDRDLFGCGPRSHPRHLPIQIRLLISRRHPRVHRSLWLRASLASQLVDQNESTNLPGRDGKSPAWNQRYAVTRATPLRSAHAARFIPLFLQHATDNYRPLTAQQLAAPARRGIGWPPWPKRSMRPCRGEDPGRTWPIERGRHRTTPA